MAETISFNDTVSLTRELLPNTKIAVRAASMVAMSAHSGDVVLGEFIGLDGHFYCCAGGTVTITIVPIDTTSSGILEIG